jgi:formiminotetrahydrofolate cyclodeaminase
MTQLVSLKGEEFLNLLASDAPAPGGGSVAAYAGAQAAALMAMVCRLTIGKKKYAEVEAEAKDALARLEALRATFTKLVDEDTQAYNAFGRAAGLPRDSDEQKAARQQAMREAAKYAATVPARTMEAAAETIRLIAALYAKTNRNCLSDAGAALLMAHASLLAASFNVSINLPGTGDEAFNRQHAERVEAARAETLPLVDRGLAEIRRLLG